MLLVRLQNKTQLLMLNRHEIQKTSSKVWQQNRKRWQTPTGKKKKIKGPKTNVLYNLGMAEPSVVKVNIFVENPKKCKTGYTQDI